MQADKELALVTGASSGIGADIARELARRKIDLVLTARRAERLEQLAAELRSTQGVQVTIVPHDLDAADSAHTLCAELAARELHVSILINNAGFGWYGDFVEEDLSEIESMLRVNLVAPTLLARRLAAAMAERGHGYVLNLSSVIAFTPSARMTLYSATKTYLLSFSQTLDMELRGRGVRVSALCPGFTATEFNASAEWDQSLMSRLMTLKSPQVARAGVAGLLRGKRVIVPGWHFKLTVFVARFLPRGLLLRLAAKFVDSPTKRN